MRLSLLILKNILLIVMQRVTARCFIKDIHPLDCTKALSLLKSYFKVDPTAQSHQKVAQLNLSDISGFKNCGSCDSSQC